MYTIFEQKTNTGEGHNIESFTKRFETICHQHKSQGRASAFAFIFHDFEDNAFKKVLKDNKVYTKLDRLSGNNLSVFYLHSKSGENTFKTFNSEFTKKLGLTDEISLPCIVFFKIDGDSIKSVNAVSFEGSDIMTSFNDLYIAIDQFIKTSHIRIDSKFIKVLKASSFYIAAEVGSYFIQKELAELLKKIQ
ncbi:hypothetical protein [Bdellovibrio sp.]|uniref:hypothetical protein n=1 Tax=Bdellovibrio sp. TaxID=28201 RepID=UPI003221CCA2